MRMLPAVLVQQAHAHGIEIHNYFTDPYYAEVLIPSKVAGCMLRGNAKSVNAFLLTFYSDELDLDDRDELVEAMEVHQLGMSRKNAMTAVCFPDWQFEPEEDA